MKFGIIDRSTNKLVSWYTGTRISYKAPFDNPTLYLHFEVVNQYPEAYYIDATGNLQYDFSYTPPKAPYIISKKIELENRKLALQEAFIEFASENSELLNNEITRKATIFATDPTNPDALDPTDAVAVATFVRGYLDPVVDSLKALKEDLEMCYFWRIEEHIAAVPRDTLIATDARLAAWQTKIINLARN